MSMAVDADAAYSGRADFQVFRKGEERFSFFTLLTYSIPEP
jgi:hypothetical protein